jgi:hypothetical protein
MSAVIPFFPKKDDRDNSNKKEKRQYLGLIVDYNSGILRQQVLKR